MIPKKRWRSVWIVLPALVAATLPGCGFSLDYLDCGPHCEDVSVPQTAHGSSSGGSAVDAADGTGGSDGSTSGADVTVAAEAAEDVSEASEVDASDGGSVDSAGAGPDAETDGGCVVCGNNPQCCAPLYSCTGNGTNCCGNAGADSDNGCCAGLSINAARKCVSMCTPPNGSCMNSSDCCLGTYCGSSNTCVPCLVADAACSTTGQCCGTCSLGFCRSGGN